MQQHETPLEPGKTYHIYNRGINGANLFVREENYRFFLQKYVLYLSDYVDTFAYCLLKNHFHLMIRVKETLITDANFGKVESTGLHHTNHIVSRQFARLFSCYTQSFNKAYGRTGGLFESPFKRKEVTSEAYFNRLLFYIHANPQLHGFTTDFTDYPHSSFAFAQHPAAARRSAGLVRQCCRLPAFSQPKPRFPNRRGLGDRIVSGSLVSFGKGPNFAKANPSLLPCPHTTTCCP